jgi:NAD-dependent dihydropyrimidine dehydrogenase PreA subunit
MGLFIDVKVSAKAAKDPECVRRLVECCPVDIFARGDDGTLDVVERNVDECTLCELCLDAAPGEVEVLKLYDEGRPLERSART